jgi:hypothetical protein
MSVPRWATTRLTAVWLLIAGLTATLLMATPAVAIAPSLIVWTAAPCATGAMTAEQSGQEMWVGGSILPCPQTQLDQHPTFAVIYFTATAGHPGHSFQYGGLTEPTPFDGFLDLRRYGQLTAVCLAFSPTGRLACYSLDFPQGLPVAASIATDDPRVTVPLSNAAPIGDTTENPFCGTCV